MNPVSLPPSPVVQRLKGALWIAASACGFGAMAIFAKTAYSAGVEVTTLLFLRFFLAGLVMAGLMLWRREAWPRGRMLLILLAMGGVGYVGQAYCYFSSLQHASAGLTAVLLYLYPALVTLLAVALGRQRLTRLKAGAVLASFAGTVLTIGGSLSGTPLGIGLGLAAALIYSVYIIVGERTTAAAGALPSSTVIIFAAAAVYGGWTLASGPTWPASLPAWGAVLGIALFSTALAIAGFFAGMRALGAADAATLSTLEPVVTIILAALFLGETTGFWQLIGGGIILASVLVLVRGEPGAADRGVPTRATPAARVADAAGSPEAPCKSGG